MTDEGSVNLEVQENLKPSLKSNVKIEEGLLMQGPINEQELKNWLKKIGLIK